MASIVKSFGIEGVDGYLVEVEQILMEVVDTKEQFDFRHTDVIYCWSRRYCSKRS